jgi:hypothetical protein
VDGLSPEEILSDISYRQGMKISSVTPRINGLKIKRTSATKSFSPFCPRRVIPFFLLKGDSGGLKGLAPFGRPDSSKSLNPTITLIHDLREVKIHRQALFRHRPTKKASPSSFSSDAAEKKKV